MFTDIVILPVFFQHIYSNEAAQHLHSAELNEKHYAGTSFLIWLF